MEEEKDDSSGRQVAEYKSKSLREREEYALSTEVRREYSSQVEEEINLKDYLDVIIRRKWVIVCCLVISIVTAMVISLKAERLYLAIATIEIAPDTPKITSFEEVVELGVQSWDIKEYYETQYRLIKSKALTKEVVNALGLNATPAVSENIKEDGGNWLLSFVKSKVLGLKSGAKNENSGIPADKVSDQLTEEYLINSFLASVAVIPDKSSRLVQVSFESPSSEFSAKAVNTLVDKYVEWIVERKVGATKAARQFLEKQLEQAKAKLEIAEENLGNFASGVDIVSLDKDLNIVSKQLIELNGALSKAETERLSKEAVFKEVESGNYQYLPQVINDESITSLREEFTKLKSQYDNLRVIYGPNYPEVKQLAAQIGMIENEIGRRTKGTAESIKRDYETTLRTEKILRQRRDEQQVLAAKQNQKAIQYKIIEREVETNKSIYDTLLQRLKETEVTSAIKTTNIQVVDYASAPLIPYKPNIRYNMLYSIMLGLIAGCAIAFVLEHFNNAIKDEEEVKRRFSSLPFLGAVPLAAENEPDIEKAVYTNPKSLIAEAFRVVRTSFLYSSADHAPKSILVTSTQPLEGKTTTASNLALSMIQSGLKIALVDADLRKPRLHKIFLSNGNAFGLSTYLVGKISLQGVINPTGIEGLSLIPSGPIPPNPAELLGSAKMRELVERLLEEYDHVILDAAPVSGFADSRLLSRQVDGVLIVTSVGITQRHTLRSCVEDILKVRGRIVGTIVNRLESRRGKYGYGYNYYYYYNDDKGDKEKKKPRLRSPRS